MALNPSVMRALVVGKIKALNKTPLPAGTDETWQAICEAICEHIQTAAQVQATVVVTSVTGVTSGAGVSGPGVGTATGTIL